MAFCPCVLGARCVRCMKEVDMKRCIPVLVLTLLTVAGYAQIDNRLTGPDEVSLCDVVTLTNTVFNLGETLSGLVITQRLPNTDFVYVPGQTRLMLPDGSTLTNAAADPTFTDGLLLVWDLSAQAGTSTVNHLLLTEVYYHTTNTDTEVEKGFQWVEIYNPMTTPVDLTGWSLRDTAPGLSDNLPPFTIAPGEFVIVAGRTNDFLLDYPGYTGRVFEVADGQIGSGLNHFGDGVILVNDSAALVDGMSYGASKTVMNPSIPTVAAGHSSARDPANEDTGVRADWVDQTVPTPGAGHVVVGIKGGESVRIIYELEVTCAAVSAQFFSSAVCEQPPGGNSVTNNSSIFLTVNQADLTVRKTPLKQSARYEDEVVWEITVENNGFGNARDIVFADLLGTGLVFTGFSIAPTNTPPWDHAVQWDSSVIPVFTNLPPGGSVSIIVTGQVISCKDLFNNAEATWGCYNFVAATNETCQDTFIGGNLKAGIEFKNFPLGVEGEILESEPIGVSYCDGTFITISLTNAYSTNYTYAFDIELIPYLPDGFGISGLNSNGQITVGDLAPGAHTNVLVHLIATNGCATPQNIQSVFFIADYHDVCGIQYSPPSLITSIVLTNIPYAAVTKQMPAGITGDSTSMTVQVLFSYEYFSTTTVSIVDTYPSDPRWSITNITDGGIQDSGNITWTNLEFTGSGVFTAQFDMVMSDRCDVPGGMNYNIISAPDFTDCQGCVRPVFGSGVPYGVNVNPGDGCNQGGTGDCWFAGSKVGPVLTEVCEPVTLAHTVGPFYGPDTPTNWNSVVFTSDLAASNGVLYTTNSVLVLIDGSNVTPYVSITATNPLVIELAGLNASPFSEPGMVSAGLEVYWDVLVTNAGRVVDISSVSMPPCGSNSQGIEWNVGDSAMDLYLCSVLNNDACGVAPMRITLSQLPSPDILAGENRVFPDYDVTVTLNLDADGDGFYSYDYMPNSTVFSNMIALGGGAIPPSEPVVDSNFVTWALGDIETNGTGCIFFNMRAGCETRSNQLITAVVEYNNRCEDGLAPQRIAYGPTNQLLPYFEANLTTTLEPEYAYLINTQYVTQIRVLNSGAGVAFNVTAEMLLPTNVSFHSAGVTQAFASVTNVLWDFQFTNAYQSLTDEDGDGYYDDLRPNALIYIDVLNNIGACDMRSITAQAWTGCKGEICSYSPGDASTFEVGLGSLVTRATFPVAGVLCGTNTVEYSVRNSGVIVDYNVNVSQVLPGGLQFMTNSFRYVYEGVTNTTATPTGSGTDIDPLVWDYTLIPEFEELQPTTTVLILYEVYIDCDTIISNEQFVAKGEYTDNCGNIYTNRQVVSFVGVDEPVLTVVKEASLDGTNYTTALLSADPGDIIHYRLTIDHAGTSVAECEAMQLSDILPGNIAYVSASLPPDSQSGSNIFWSTTNLMAQVGGAPYLRTDGPIEIYVTGTVTDCGADQDNSVLLEYGCDETSLCLTETNTHRVRTLPVNNINAAEALSLKTCGGFKTISISNSGSSATGLMVTETAPDGFLFAGGAVSGAFYSANLIIADWGSPSGSLVTVDFTSTNSSGAIDVDDPGATTLYWRSGEVLYFTFRLISAGDNLDCLADPTDNNFEDPGYGDPSQVSSVSTMLLNSACGGGFTNTASSTTYPLIPNPNIDLQPNSLVVTNGEVVTMTATVINQSEGGDASNLYMRLRLGAAWTNVSIVSTQLNALSGAVVTEVVGATNIIINLPGVNLRPYIDRVVITFEGTAVEGPGSLRVLSEVVGDCGDSQIIPSCVFTNIFGEPPLADTMTGAIQPTPLDGEYYAFDQDMSVFAGFSIEKSVRYDDQDVGDAGTFRDARIGEGMLYNIEAHYFGEVFSNVTIIESLPDNLVFADATDFTNTLSGNFTGAVYSAGTFTLTPTILDTTNHPSIFTVDIPVTASNGWQNQDGVIFSNTATSAFDVDLFTNAVPVSTTDVQIVEPLLTINKTVNSNEVQEGDYVDYTITITNIGATNAYSLVIEDTLPQGLLYVTSTPPAQVVGQTITITTNEDSALANVAVNGTYTYAYQALVTNQVIGSTMYNDARVTWTSLDAASVNSQERDGSDGPGGLNDYYASNNVAITARDIWAIHKNYVSSSQTNTIGSNTFTIGERVIYSIRVDMPQGIAENVSLVDFVPTGMDFVGPNGDGALAWPGYGYTFTVPGGGPVFPLTTNDGLVIIDPDPTPYTSTNNDGSGLDITFNFGAITNLADGDPNNDYFILSMEMVILNDPVNTGLTSGYTVRTNGAQISDAFITLGATGPVYGVAEHDIHIGKGMNPTTVIASNIVTVSLVVSNRSIARSTAYDIQAYDFFPVAMFNTAPLTDISVPDGWLTSNQVAAGGITHYLYTTNTTGLAPGAAITNIFTIQVAQSVIPNAIYTNRAYVQQSSTLYGAPPSGIPEREDTANASRTYTIPGFGLDKYVFATSETNIPPDSTNHFVQIGEVITYQLDVTLPESTITNLAVTDYIPAGLAYVNGSAYTDTGAFSGELGALQVTPSTGGLTEGNGVDMTFTFLGNTVCAGDNETTSDTFSIYFDALVLNTNSNSGLPVQTILTNRASVTYAHDRQPPVQSGITTNTVIEPVLRIFKQMTPTNIVAGDVVAVTFSATNAGTATAYDILITDVFAPCFDAASIQNTAFPTGFSYQVIGNTLTIVSDTNAPTGTNSIESGESLSFTFDISVAQCVQPNAIVTNIVTILGDSLSATNVFDEQRTTGDTNAVVLQVLDFNFIKRLYATSETGPADSVSNLVQIGEVVTYELEAALPYGTITNLQITDFIPEGMAYVVDSLVTLPASTNIVMAPITNVTPNAGLLGADGENMVATYLGNTLVYPVTNAADATLRLRLQAIVLDTNSNVGIPVQTILTNRACITYVGNPAPPRLSNITTNPVIEPQLDIAKSISLTSGDAGDRAVITLVVTNSGLATAYNLSFNDSITGAYFDTATITNETIPDGFLFTVTTSAPNAMVIYSSDPASGQPTNSIEAAESLTFEFSVLLSQSVEPAQLLTNIAFVAVAETIDGTNIYDVTRDESGAWSDATMVVSNMAIAKVFIGTSETGPADTTGTNVTIGEVVTYRLTAELPESTITNLTLTDRIPVGMSYVPGSVSVDTTSFNGALPGAPTVTTGGGSGDDVSFEFEGLTVVNIDNLGTNNFFTMDFELLMLDIAGNVGLPGSQTIRPNSATISYDGHPNADTSSVVNVIVVEPLLDITKQMVGPSNDLVWLDLVITNNGLSTAYDVEITDVFPSNWWNTASITGTAPTGFVFSITNAPGNAYLTILSDTNYLQPTNCIEVGGSVSFSFQGLLQPGREGTITNEAIVSQYTTIDGTNANERFEPPTNDIALLNLPSFDIDKTRTMPAGRAAAPGETIQFAITLTNTGHLGFGVVSVTDTYDAVYLSFDSAVPPVDTSVAGTLTWTNVGPLSIGASTTLLVNFTALLSTLPGDTTNWTIGATVTTNDLPVPAKTNSAVVPIINAGYTLDKALTSPLGRSAQVGEAISFTITIVNTADVQLVTIPVVDSFDDSYLNYAGAIPPVDISALNTLTWTDVGPLNGGATTTLVVNFTAQASTASLPETNIVVTAPTTPANMPNVPIKTNEDTYAISEAGYSLVKTRTSPAGRAAEIGEAITFDILITNTGDVQLVTVPVIDTFDDTYLIFNSTVPTESSNDTGIIYWDDIGPLNAGASTTLVVNFTAEATTMTLPETNTVSTAPTTPPTEPNVPERTNDAPYAVSIVGYTLDKTLMAPTNRAAQVGETITFNVTIVNTGEVQLTTIPVVDTFNDALLDFSTAVPAADSNDTDHVYWDNVGPLVAGASTTLVLNFTAQATTLSQLETNVVETTPTTPPTEPGVPPKTNDAPYEISSAGYLLTKTLTSPSGRAAEIGETISFDVAIVNTGDVVLVTVPVGDTFDDSYLDFLSAVPPVDASGVGSLSWTDVGPLAVGATTTLVVNFTAQATTFSLPETNTVDTAPTTPVDEPDVDPQTNDAPYEISSAGYDIIKTLTSPLGRAAQVGETISFDLLITNTGDVQLVVIPVIDTFDDAYLNFSSAVPPVSSNATGILYWDDVGTLAGGASTTLVVNFTAQASTLSMLETNTVETAPTTPGDEPNVDPKTNDAPYEISQVGYEAVKTLISPVGISAIIGETITFNLTVNNTGDVNLVTVPVADLFDDSYLDFLSAVPPVDSSGVGTLSWTDVGPLAAGATTTLVVNFTAQATTLSLPETNTVVTSPTTPPTEPNLPPVTNEAPYEISSAGYTILKTYTSPAGRAAQVGETISFDLLITNTGDVQLVVIPVVDTFDNAYLNFLNAIPPADSNDTGIIYWDDVGTLAVGSSTTLVVNFTAQASTLSIAKTNTAETAPTTPADRPNVLPKTNDAPYEISEADFLVSKELISPTGRAAQVSETITFNLVVTNSGDVAFVTLPITDTFDDSYLDFLSAIPPADSNDTGIIYWNDVGALPVGASTTLVVNFTAQASTLSQLETNTVIAGPTTPPTEPNLPPRTNDTPYEISQVGYEAVKTLISPAGRAAQVGETITFNLTVNNTGDVALITVPVDDTFDDSYLDFLSAVPPVDSSGLGAIAW
ncbi:MAG: DUF11 domain-containing protein, partial [Spartobacteria bacterium]|nr:DUF11 domain-containing protein [Spartobacteria bacterium]